MVVEMLEEVAGDRRRDLAAIAGLVARLGEVCVAPRRAWETVTSGFRAIDGLLPSGGVCRGSLIEWRAVGDAAEAETDAGGVVAVACAVACRLASHARLADQAAPSTIVVVDRGGRFYPPAVMPWFSAAAEGGEQRAGGKRPFRPPASDLVVVRPSRDNDEVWAIDQAARCPGVAAVVAWPEKVSATAARRLQLAVRASGTVCLLVQGLPVPLSSRAEPHAFRRRGAKEGQTWADARVSVAPIRAAQDDVNGCSFVRRFRLSLEGGTWASAVMHRSCAAELLLDLATGREAVVRHRSADCLPAAGSSMRMGGQEPQACRAS